MNGLAVVDTTPPVMESVGSLNGIGVGVCFSEPLDPVTATNPANYAVWDLNSTNSATSRKDLVVTGVTLRPDGQSISLSLSEPLRFTLIRVWATNIQDVAGNVMTNEYVPGPVGFKDGQPEYILTADLPRPGADPLEAGSMYTCGRGYEVRAGGSGLESTNDGFHFRFGTSQSLKSEFESLDCKQPLGVVGVLIVVLAVAFDDSVDDGVDSRCDSSGHDDSDR